MVKKCTQNEGGILRKWSNFGYGKLEEVIYGRGHAWNLKSAKEYKPYNISLKITWGSHVCKLLECLAVSLLKFIVEFILFVCLFVCLFILIYCFSHSFILAYL